MTSLKYDMSLSSASSLDGACIVMLPYSSCSNDITTKLAPKRTLIDVGVIDEKVSTKIKAETKCYEIKNDDTSAVARIPEAFSKNMHHINDESSFKELHDAKKTDKGTCLQPYKSDDFINSNSNRFDLKF